MNTEKFLLFLNELIDFNTNRLNERLYRLDQTLINPKDDYLCGKVEGIIEVLNDIIIEVEEGSFDA